jgi:thioredoxin-related protein
LHKKVLPKKEFTDYAKKNLVLVEVDFPMKKKLPDSQVKANEALMEKFKIEGFPTLLLLDGDGKRLGKVDLTMDPKELVKNIEKVAKQK